MHLRAQKNVDGSYSSEVDPFDADARDGDGNMFGKAELQPGQVLYLPARMWYAFEPSVNIMPDDGGGGNAGAHNLRVAFAYEAFGSSDAIWETVFGAIAPGWS